MAFINNIILHNFYNYFGENNEYKFQNGMNIVVADNNGGKSKLYNAFLLIISNSVIDSDTRKLSVLESNKEKFKIISDKAKKESQLDEKIKTGVDLTFETETYIFTFKKFFISTKINDESPYLIENWNIGKLQTAIIRKTIRDNQTVLIDLEKEQEKLKILLPVELKNYCMFQGEEVVNLVNMGLTNAINKLTDLKKFNYFEIFLNDIYKSSDKKLRNEEKKLASNKGKALDLDNEINNINEIYEVTKVKLNQKNNDLTEIEQQIFDLSKKIGEAKQQNEIFKKIGSNSANIDTITTQISDFEKYYNQNFFYDNWLLKGFSIYKEKFDKLRSSYDDSLAEQKMKDFKTSLPQDSPDISSLDRMLKDEICLVCNRKAKKGTKPYKHITKLKYEHETGKQREGYSAIKIFGDNLYREVNNFPSDIDIENSIKEKMKYYEELKKENVKLSNEKNELINKRISNKDENIKIIEDHLTQIKLKSQLENQISQLDLSLNELSTSLKSKKRKLSELVKDNALLNPLKRKVQILEDLIETFNKTRIRFYQEESKKFNNSINEIYKSLTKGNDTNPGEIAISVDKRFHFNSELINSEGGELSGQGAAFQRMKQLAIVMGLMNESRRSSSFPLIADAPISEMGQILTQNFFYNVPKVFTQSIIFIKDFYKEGGVLDDLGKKIIFDSALNVRAFMNEAIGPNQQERETKIKILQK